MEEYKRINDYENYEINACGSVRKVKTKVVLKASLHKGYYRIGLCKNGKQKLFYVHKLIALSFIPNPDNKILIDHIDRDPLNNNVNNLRWCSRSENQINRGTMKNNKSSISGVRKCGNKWRVTITLNTKAYHLGMYLSFEDAKNAREEGEIKYFGIFKPLNQ